MKITSPTSHAASIFAGLLLLHSDLSAQTVLNFSDTATLISGVSEQLGAQYRYSNVGTVTGGGGTFDAILTLLAESNGASFSLPEPQDTLIGIGQDGRFRIEPSFKYENPNGSFSFVEFNIRFVESGTLVAVTGESVRLVAFDIDSQSNLDYSDVFGVQHDIAGSYTVAENTGLVNSITDGSWDTYRRFSLDTATNLSSAPNASTAATNFSQNQSPYSVQFDIANVGASGINFLWGMEEGSSAGGYDHNNVRTVLIDGSGTFAFTGNTVTTLIPEPAAPILGGLGLALLLLRRPERKGA